MAILAKYNIAILETFKCSFKSTTIIYVLYGYVFDHYNYVLMISVYA